MHEQKGFVIAVAFTAVLFSCSAVAQKDAAEKAKEGAIDHWIEYYKAGQRKPAAAAPAQSQPVPPPTSQPAAGASPQGKAN